MKDQLSIPEPIGRPTAHSLDEGLTAESKAVPVCHTCKKPIPTSMGCAILGAGTIICDTCLDKPLGELPATAAAMPPKTRDAASSDSFAETGPRAIGVSEKPGFTEILVQTDVDEFEVAGYSRDEDEEREVSLACQGFFESDRYIDGQTLAESPEEALSLEIESAPTCASVGGMIVDIETGEILGLESGPFEVSDEGSADWVLRLILSEEAALAAIESTAAVTQARAVLSNAEGLKKDRSKRLDYLHYRFDNELGEFARQQLKGSKGRTYKTLSGSIALKTLRGGLRVKDELAALTFARSQGWTDAIKTSEKFLISALSAEQAKVAGMAVPYAFVIQADHQTVTVKTGVPGPTAKEVA